MINERTPKVVSRTRRNRRLVVVLIGAGIMSTAWFVRWTGPQLGYDVRDSATFWMWMGGIAIAVGLIMGWQEPEPG